MQLAKGNAFDGKIEFEKDAAGKFVKGPFGENVVKTKQTPIEKSTNELQIDNDIMVLANPEIAKLPAWIVALVAAGGLAAALSTAAGLLLVIASAFSHDLMKSIVNEHVRESRADLGAFCCRGAVIIAGYFGINPPGFVAQVVAFAFGLAASSFFPVIIMGIFVRKATKEGAIAGMFSGIVFTAAYIIYFKFMNPPTFNVAANWLWGISPEGIGSVGMVVNFIVTSGFQVYKGTS